MLPAAWLQRSAGAAAHAYPPLLPLPPSSQAGLDSLGAVELRAALAARFSVELPATAVFDYPTVAALAGCIARLLPSGGGDADDGDGAGSDWGSAEWGGSPSGMLALGAAGADAELVTDLVGVGCRYPGAPAGGAATTAAGLGAFWEGAVAGANLQALVPHQRWDADWCYSAGPVLGRSYARFAAFAEVRRRAAAA